MNMYVDIMRLLRKLTSDSEQMKVNRKISKKKGKTKMIVLRKEKNREVLYFLLLFRIG